MDIDYSLIPGRKNIDSHIYKKENTVISIITPYFNVNKYIEDTAKSVLKQTFPYFEWIIVDDGSTDQKSIEKLEELKKLDTRIKIFHKKNEGPAAARDFGAEKATKTSKYLLFLDADDLINETYLECAYWALETNPKASWTYCDTINFGEEESLWQKWYLPSRMINENILVMTALIRKEAFFKVNGFEIKEKEIYEDWYLWIKMIKEGMYPVRMSFLGFWYRKKVKSESQLQKANCDNRCNALKYIKKITSKIDKDKLKEGIQFPRDNYNWNEIIEEYPNIITPKIEQKNGKINILFIMPWMTVGGADKFNLDIVKRINKDKYNFIIITTEPSNNPWRQQFEEFATIYDLTTFLNRESWIAFLNYIIEKNNIDIILNSNSTFGYNSLPYLKTKHPEIPIIDYIHMEEWYNRNGGFSRDSSRVSSVIDKTYVCNKNSENILINYFKRKPEDINTIYIGVDEKVFNPKKYDKNTILNKLKIKSDGKYIISYICRISEQKRPFLLLEIISQVKKIRDDCLFVIAGDGNLFDEMKNRAKKMQLLENIIFLGNVKNTSEIYAISDITINCSIKEGLALTAYESLSMGVPVISSNVGGQKELISDDVGVIVPCLQKEKDIFDYNYKKEEIMPYVKAINKILNNMQEYKQNARKRILNGFTIDNMISNMDKVFENVLKNPNIDKIENAKKMQANIDITKELITKYYISAKPEFQGLINLYNQNNIDLDLKNNKNMRREILYENTLEYKIKHPIYVVLKKLHLYDFIKKILKKEK